MGEKELRLRYDSGADVLYCSLGEPVEAISEEVADGVFLRLNPSTDEVVGLTVIDFVKRSSERGETISLPLTSTAHPRANP